MTDTNQNDDECFSLHLQFTALETVYCLVERSSTTSVNSSASTGLRRLLNAIIQPNKIWVYSSEEGAVAARTKVQAAFGMGELDYAPFSLPLILNQAELMKGGTLYVNYGEPTQFEVSGQAIPGLKKFALLQRLAHVDLIWILQDGRGVALLKERDGKKYALGFLSREEGDIVLHRTKTKSPGVDLERNRPRALAEGLLSSPVDGLILNYQNPNETTLDRNDLENIVRIVFSTGGTTFGFFKKLLPR